MDSQIEWGIAGVLTALAAYFFMVGYYGHAVSTTFFALLVIYLNLEPIMINRGLVRKSVIDRIKL